MKTAKKMWHSFLQHKGKPTDVTAKAEMDDLLKEFWPSLLTMKGKPFRATSLLSIRQLLRVHIMETASVDIMWDPELQSHNAVFDNYLKTLKKDGYGYVSHHKEIPKADLQKIYNSLDMGNPQQLQWLAWLTLQLHLCRRGIENTNAMKKLTWWLKT